MRIMPDVWGKTYGLGKTLMQECGRETNLIAPHVILCFS